MSDDVTLEIFDDESDFVLYDETNPRALTNILPKKVADAVRAVPRDLLLQNELDLEKHVKPSATLNYVRLNFWLEYNRAQENRKEMDMRMVMRGVAKMDYFFKVILKNHPMLAWVLCPPADFSLVQRDILYSGLRLLRQAMKIKLVTVKETIVVDKSGKETRKVVREPNVPAIAEVRRIVEMLSDRVQGAVIQKVAIRQQTLTDGRAPAPANYEPDALDELNKTLANVNRQLSAAAEVPVTLEIIKGEHSEVKE